MRGGLLLLGLFVGSASAQAVSLMDSPGFYLPNAGDCTTAGNNYATSTLDAAGDDVAWVFPAPKTGEIRKVGFITGTVTTGDTIDVRMETVDGSTGFPSGTLCATNTNVSQAIADTDDTKWFTTTLTADCPVTAETLYAVVLNAPAGWVAGSIPIRVSVSSTQLITGVPYRATDPGTGYVKATNVGAPLYLEYDDGTTEHIPGFIPVSATSGNQYNLNTAVVDERGVRLLMPFAARAVGLWVVVGHAAASDAEYLLYDTDGTTVLQTVSVDGDNQQGTGNSFKTYLFDTPVILNASGVYRVSVRPTTTGNVTVITFTACGNPAAAACLDLWSGGQNIYTTTRVNQGSWTDTTTTRECMGLIIDGAGGSGAVWGF